MKRNNGLTLLEIMIVIFIISSVVIAVPAFHLWFQRQGVRLAVAQLQTDLHLARIMAIRRKQICSIDLNTPGRNQYTNSLSHQTVDLSSYRGGVHFLSEGPDGGTMVRRIIFNRRGMAFSLGSAFMADKDQASIFRVRVLTPGGISVFRWSKDGWR